jgi:heme exporter protein D
MTGVVVGGLFAMTASLVVFVILQRLAKRERQEREERERRAREQQNGGAQD